MDRRSGRLFDLPAKINIGIVSKESSIGRGAFTSASKTEYRGIDKPVDWEVKQIGKDKVVYYVPKRDGYILVDRKDEILDVKLLMDVDYRIFTVGVLELIQLATTRPVIHAITINHGSEGILVNGDSGKGKTTLLLQLINAKMPIQLISEDRSMIENGRSYSISALAQIRKNAGRYVGLKLDIDRYVEMSAYLSVRDMSNKISIVVHPVFNLEERYEIAGILQNSFKPLHRDWFMQVFTDKERDDMLQSKLEGLKQLPSIGHEFHYSTDPSITLKLFKGILRD